MIDPPRKAAISRHPQLPLGRHPGQDDHRRPRRHGARHRPPDRPAGRKALTGRELAALDDAALAAGRP
jgi:hypothetical protein